MKFITPLQLTPRPAQRSLTFIQDTPPQSAAILAQAARLSHDVNGQIPTSKTTPSPSDSPQQTPGYSPDGGSPPLTPQQKKSDSETRTLLFKQQRTRSPLRDPFDEDESPHFPHEILSPFSQDESSSRPVSPEPAPKHHRTGPPSPLHVETDNQNHLSTDPPSDDEIVVKRPCLDRPLPAPVQTHASSLKPTAISSPPSSSPPPQYHPLPALPHGPLHASPLPADWEFKSKTAKKHWMKRNRGPGSHPQG